MKRLENIGRILRDVSDGEGAVMSLDDLPEAGTEIAGSETQTTGETTEGASSGDNPKYEVPAYWNELSQALSNEDNVYELPDVIKTGKSGDGKDLSPAESFQLLAKEIQANTRIPELEDPFIKDAVLDMRKYGENLDRNKFIERYAQQQQISSMSDEDYFFDQMKKENGESEKNPEGWTDEEIRNDIATRGRIELSRERKALEAENVARYQQQVDAREAQILEKRKEEMILRQNADDARLLEVEKFFKENRNINGIEVGESDMTDAIEEFRALNQFDENGEKPIFKLFEKDNDLFKAFFLVRSKGTLVKDIIAGMKTDLAKNILDRTSLHPKDPTNQFGGVGNSIPTKEDLLDLI